MFGLGSSELVVIVILIFVLFGGGKKIPELFAGLGKGIRSFKKSMNEDDDNDKTSAKKDQIDHKSTVD